MAIQTNAYSPWLPAAYDSFFTKLGQGLNSYIETRSRRAEIAALEAMSDEELAQVGITRDRIVHYVFRDLVWV